MKIVLPILTAAVAVTGIAAVATAQAPATSAQAPAANERVTRVVVYGNDPCPRGSGDEIVVCARRPDNERYRIPEELRGEGQRESESWAVRAQSLETVGDTGIQSCSTVGPGGFTGCWEEMMRQAREARRNPQPRR
jgi:hypothetical protein